MSAKGDADNGGNRAAGGAWLSERDLDFFVGGGRGVGEQEAGSGVAPGDEGVVGRRLALTALATAAFVAWSLVPDDTLAPTPSKPLFLYLVTLVRARQLLTGCESATADADWPRLKALRATILGSAPGDTPLREQMTNAAALVPDGRRREAAKALVGPTVENIVATDYNAYFDTVGQPSGAQNAEFAAFCGAAVRSGEKNLDAFLALMPSEDLDAAKAQVAASSSWVVSLDAGSQ